MNDVAATRRRNLRSLKLGPAQLVEKVGRTYSYWRDMLNDEKKSFGEKISRAIEQALDLPPGWLDIEHSPGSKSKFIASETPATYKATPSLEQALPVVLDALATAPERDKVRAALTALLDDDAPAYRERLAELLSERKLQTPTADRLLGTPATRESAELRPAPSKR